MSEYLDRLKHLRDATPPPGNAKNVQDNVAFRKAIDYIEKLEKELERSIVVINNERKISIGRKSKIHDMYEQREADATILRCNIAGHYITPKNGDPVSLSANVHNESLDIAIDIVNKHYEAE